MKPYFIASTLALLLFHTGAFAGNDAHHHAMGASPKVSRTIRIDMDDAMRFTPPTIAVKRGETIRFVVSNTGRVKHEMVLGSIDQLKEHAAMMMASPAMEHAESNQVSVDPGKSGELIWQFAKAGNVDFACLQPGHFEAGMRGKIVVR